MITGIAIKITTKKTTLRIETKLKAITINITNTAVEEDIQELLKNININELTKMIQ